MNQEFDIELTLKIIAIIISTLAFLKGINEYKKAQKWKKLEFVSKEIKDFFNDFNIQRAIILLDWNSNTLEVLKNEIDDKEEFYFDDNILFDALKTHYQSATFNDKEVVIKKIFDTFLDKLSMFENYIETGLIETKDILPYLNYYINILANPKNDRKSAELRKQIWKYIDDYGYEKVRNLCYRKEFKSKNGY